MGNHNPPHCPVTIPTNVSRGSGSYNLVVTRERWAQLGITVQFLIIVRSLGEIYRLKHFHSANFSLEIATPYVGGALIAAFLCWLSVTLYFFRRYILSASVALAAIFILVAYKIALIGW